MKMSFPHLLAYILQVSHHIVVLKNVLKVIWLLSKWFINTEKLFVFKIFLINELSCCENKLTMKIYRIKNIIKYSFSFSNYNNINGFFPKNQRPIVHGFSPKKNVIDVFIQLMLL